MDITLKLRINQDGEVFIENSLLLEDGTFIFLENNTRILLEED